MASTTSPTMPLAILVGCLANYGYTNIANACDYGRNILDQPAGPATNSTIGTDTGHLSAYTADVLSYFEGLSQRFIDSSGGRPLYGITVYGCADVLDAVNSSNLAQYTRLTDTPSRVGSLNHTNYSTLQHSSRYIATFAGVEVDHNATVGFNLGQRRMLTTRASSKSNDFNRDGTSDILWRNDNGLVHQLAHA